MTTSQQLAILGQVGIIGAGALGTALARALAAHGATISAVAARSLTHARDLAAVLPGTTAQSAEQVVRTCDLIILAVPDDALSEVAATLPWCQGQRVLHLSGARDSAVLAPARAIGASTAALHPLMIFPSVDLFAPLEHVMARFRGCSWALETLDSTLEADLTHLVTALEGRVVHIRAEDRLPYHLAAVLASNDVLALLSAAMHLWESIGFDAASAQQALLPLVRATIEKLTTDALPTALSGPVARGDVGTIAAHLTWLDALAADDPEGDALRMAYRALGKLAIPLAETKGTLSPAAAAQLRRLFETPRER